MITTTAKGLKFMNNYTFNVEHMGNEIKLARVKAGLTQEQLAEKAGTTKTTIVAVEKGEKQSGGNIMLIANIAAVLNLSLDEICGINARPAESNEQDIKNKILNAIKTLLDLDKSQIRLSKRNAFFDDDIVNLNITIADTGLAYFAQEYNNALKTIEVNRNTEYYEDIKTTIMNAFECRFIDMKLDHQNYYSFDREKGHFEISGDNDNVTITLDDFVEIMADNGVPF